MNRDLCHSFKGSFGWKNWTFKLLQALYTCKFISTSRSTYSERLKAWKIKFSLDFIGLKFKSTCNYNILKTEDQKILIFFFLYSRGNIKWANTRDFINNIHQYTKFNSMKYISFEISYEQSDLSCIWMFEVLFGLRFIFNSFL